MSTTYRPAPAVQRIAKDLIAKHHHHLDDIRIEYVFRSEAATSNGKTVMGKARKITGLNAYLVPGARPGRDARWRRGRLLRHRDRRERVDDPRRRPTQGVVDHELCHCTTDWDKDDNLVLKIKAHDLEEFKAVVDRHGLWQPDLCRFAEAIPFQQLRLEDELAGDAA